jgi:hypothetical protein
MRDVISATSARSAINTCPGRARGRRSMTVAPVVKVQEVSHRVGRAVQPKNSGEVIAIAATASWGTNASVAGVYCPEPPAASAITWFGGRGVA